MHKIIGEVPLLLRGATTFSKLGVQFLGLGYCAEQNTDGIPSFVDCSLLRSGNHTLHQKSWGGPSNFFLGGGGFRTPRPPSGCALASAVNFFGTQHLQRVSTMFVSVACEF